MVALLPARPVHICLVRVVILSGLSLGEILIIALFCTKRSCWDLNLFILESENSRSDPVPFRRAWLIRPGHAEGIITILVSSARIEDNLYLLWVNQGPFHLVFRALASAKSG